MAATRLELVCNDCWHPVASAVVRDGGAVRRIRFDDSVTDSTALRSGMSTTGFTMAPVTHLDDHGVVTHTITQRSQESA